MVAEQVVGLGAHDPHGVQVAGYHAGRLFGDVLHAACEVGGALTVPKVPAVAAGPALIGLHERLPSLQGWKAPAGQPWRRWQSAPSLQPRPIGVLPRIVIY